MAIKDRITGLFKRGGRKQKEEAPTPTITPSSATEEERQEVLRGLGDGFNNVGKVIERLDRHLEAGTRSLEGMTQTQNRLPGMLEQQRELIERTNTVAQTQQEALELFKQHLQQRDEAGQAMVERLEELGKGLHQLREQDRSRMELLMHFQRSGRRMVMFMGLLGVVVILLLMGLLIVISLRPDLLGLSKPQDDGGSAGSTPVSQATTQENGPGSTDLDDARRSPNPAIRDFASESDADPSD